MMKLPKKKIINKTTEKKNLQSWDKTQQKKRIKTKWLGIKLKNKIQS